jgi:hypothetical protein
MVLGDVSGNASRNASAGKEAGAGKENGFQMPKTPSKLRHHDDEMADLFGTPPARPTTPTSRPHATPFKTPTRPTPSHRPITRSVSKSIRSVAKTPSSAAMLQQLQRTPSKTPRSSASKRRPHHQQHLLPAEYMQQVNIESPFTANLMQLLSEANEFTAGSSAHGLDDLDLDSLPNLDSDAAGLDFGSYLSTDMVMPSSPPLLGRVDAAQHHVTFEPGLWDGMDGLDVV